MIAALWHWIRYRYVTTEHPQLPNITFFMCWPRTGGIWRLATPINTVHLTITGPGLCEFATIRTKQLPILFEVLPQVGIDGLPNLIRQYAAD